MASDTLIAWTDHTANFWMGCCKISPGCAHCYAETLTTNRMGLHLWGPPKTTARQAVKGVWANVRAWEREAARSMAGQGAPGVLGPGKPHLCFVGSLMDWAEDAPGLDAIRAKMWPLFRECPHLHFQMLTKRADRIARLLPDDWGDGYPNVWLGVSIESNDYAWRGDLLREVPAVVRFVSYEPAMGPLDDLVLQGLDWIVQGYESGPKFRTGDLQWARDLRDRCAAAGVAYFYKQSAGYRTEMGITLDGQMIRNYPKPRVRR